VKSSLSQTTLPPTSLIICSRNRPQLLLETVQSVLQGDDVPTELIIVDQSDAPHAQLATLTSDRPCAIRYLHVQSRGVSQARNDGIAAAQYDILAFTDDDVFVAPAWYGALIGALVAAGPRSVITGRVLATAAETPGGFAPATVISETPAIYQGRLQRDVLEAGNAALYRAATDEIGGYDPRLGPGTRFPAGEDNDFGLRLLSAGYRIAYVPEAVIYHRAWRSKNDYWRVQWNYGIGQGAYYGKYLSLRDRYMLGRLVRLLLRSGRRLVRRLRYEPLRAWGHAVYAVGVCCGVARWLAGRPGRGERKIKAVD
jgi:GT2 family glycosyltransferase